jgi:glycerol-3-phosphate O-acyltransferase
MEHLVGFKVGETPEVKVCVEQSLAEGRQAYMLRRISSEASIGKILFENGYKLAENFGLTDTTTEEIVGKRRALLAELRLLARRMERMRIDVLADAEKAMEMEYRT